MLNKMWQSIQGWVNSLNQKKPQPIAVMKTYSKPRFLITNENRANENNQNVETDRKVNNIVVPTNKEELQTLYGLICQQQYDREECIKIEEAEENEKFLNELAEVEKKIQTLDINVQSEIQQAPYERMDNIVSEMKRVNNCGKQEAQMYLQYKKDVLTVLDTKYRAQKNDSPQITFQQFKEIKKLWMAVGRQTEKNVPGCLHLKVKDLQLLENRKWLNDQIISEYVSLLKEQIEKNQTQHSTNLKLLNSLQVSSFFDRKKYDKAKVQKFFHRQKITPRHTVIMAVHKVNHWIFIKINRNGFFIYDSIYRSNVDDYIRFPTLANIFEFMSQFYGQQLSLSSLSDFPQQYNDYDCGMMMLSGIKDVVKNSLKWSFTQNEIPYRRFLVAKQLMDHRLVGFDYSF